MKHVTDFFNTHPGCDEVHEALGYLFTNKEDAEAMLAGVANSVVTTHSRYSIAVPDEEDKEQADAEVQSQVEEELPPIIHNDATTYGKSAEEVAELNKEAKKNQKPAKESAEKAKAKGKPKG